MNFIWNSYNLCTAMLNFAQNKASLTTVSEDLTKTFYCFASGNGWYGQVFFPYKITFANHLQRRSFNIYTCIFLLFLAIEKTKKFLGMVTNNNPGLVVDAYLSAVCSRYPAHRYLVGMSAQVVFRILWNLPESISDFILCLGRPVPVNLKTSWHVIMWP